MSPFVSRPIEERFWEKVAKGEGCWEWQGRRTKPGYGRFWPQGLKGPAVQAHRIAWELVNGPIPAGLYVCHSCDNPPCVRPDHLWLGTNRENQLDAVAKGRGNAGERNNKARISTADAEAIRASTEATGALAIRYGISPGHVWRIRRGERWAHVHG